MKLDMIKENTTIVAPTYLHNTIREQLLQQLGVGRGILISSLSQLLEEDTSDELLFLYYQSLKSLYEKLSIFKSSISSPSFLQEIITLIKHMKQYSISCEQLPKNNAIQKELATIVMHLFPLSNQIKQQKAFQRLLKQAENHALYLVDGYRDHYEERIYQTLLKEGAILIPFPKKAPTKEYYTALNKREECECCAQYIIANDLIAEDVMITLLNPEYLPFIKMLFHHYQIPYQMISSFDQKDSLLKTQYLALLNYVIQPNNTNSIALIASNLLFHPHQEDAIQYLKIYGKSLTDSFHLLDSVSLQGDIIEERELIRLQRLEEHARAVQEQWLTVLAPLQQLSTLLELCKSIDDILVAHHTFHEKEDYHLMIAIRDCVLQASHHLTKKEDLPFIAKIIAQLRVPKSNEMQGVLISDLTHPFDERPYHFILGCTQKNYPATPTFQGVFQEDYYEAIGYPSLEERYQLHCRGIAHLFHNCDHLIASYPLSTFDGKANESALEIEQHMPSAKSYPYQGHYEEISRSPSITRELAMKLYLKKDTLYGSISSFERYASCPYAYFLRYGLQLKEPIDHQFNAAKAGTLIHHVFETLVKKYGKPYWKATQDEIQTLLKNNIQDMRALYPNRSSYFYQMEQRLFDSIQCNLKILQDYEQHSSLHPAYCEKNFDYLLPLPDKKKLHLHGIVDRIDINHDFFAIIDYKSSVKKLKEEFVFSALQLQLITYLCIMKEQLKIRPLGCFYYSFANPFIAMEYGKVKRRPLGITLYKEEDGIQNFYKEKRFNGWVCDENIEAMDDTATHIKGIRNYKTDGITAATIYESDTLFQYLKNIYEQLAESILNGNISTKHVADACIFCPYHALCNEENNIYRKKEMVEVTSALYQKGGRKDAKVES